MLTVIFAIILSTNEEVFVFIKMVMCVTVVVRSPYSFVVRLLIHSTVQSFWEHLYFYLSIHVHFVPIDKSKLKLLPSPMEEFMLRWFVEKVGCFLAVIMLSVRQMCSPHCCLQRWFSAFSLAFLWLDVGTHHPFI